MFSEQLPYTRSLNDIAIKITYYKCLIKLIFIEYVVPLQYEKLKF